MIHHRGGRFAVVVYDQGLGRRVWIGTHPTRAIAETEREKALAKRRQQTPPSPPTDDKGVPRSLPRKR